MFMLKIMVKVYKLRFKIYERLRNRQLDKAKEHLFDEDITEYKRCMSRVLYYIKKIEKVTKRSEELVYGRKDLA